MFNVNIMVAIIIVILISIIFNLIIEKNNQKINKKTPFESGFNIIFNKKRTFTTNFLLISIIFLIFDVEITFLIPTTLTNKSREIIINLCLCFLALLTIILTKEWKQGSLEWTK